MSAPSGQQRDYHVLGIETSCDDTAAGVITSSGAILSNHVESQLKHNIGLGGVLPNFAREWHLSYIDKVANEAFEKSSLSSFAREIDAVAVSTRPGMVCNLKIGLNYARTLAKKYDRPLIPIHHMQAHALMPLLEHRSIRFPFLSLLISGGHAILAVAKRYNDFHLLGSCLDNAPGEVLDKVARKLKLRDLGSPYESISGGAAIELLSQQAGADRFKYFRSVKVNPARTDCDMSFGGCWTPINRESRQLDHLRSLKKRPELIQELGHFCSSLQRYLLFVMAEKTLRAIAYYASLWRNHNEDAFADTGTISRHLGFGVRCKNEPVDLVISGGCAANNYMLSKLRLICQECVDDVSQVYAPSRPLCSDNGVMIAWNGALRLRDFDENRQTSSQRTAPPDDAVIFDKSQMDELTVEPRWPIGTDLRDLVRLSSFKVPYGLHPEVTFAAKAASPGNPRNY